MTSGALLDTGPLLAYLYPREKNHHWAVEQFDALDLPLLTCEPVLTEACFLLGRLRLPAARVLEVVRRGVVRIALEVQLELPRLHDLMERYRNLPMSLADACLVRMAEMTRLPICTLDSDFAIYRAHGRRPIGLISPAPRHLHEP